MIKKKIFPIEGLYNAQMSIHTLDYTILVMEKLKKKMPRGNESKMTADEKIIKIKKRKSFACNQTL